MSVGLDSFRNIAFDHTTQDTQRIFAQKDRLQEKSSFGFFHFFARKRENDATVNSFLSAIKTDPTYKAYLSSATGLLKSQVPAGKPLTAKVVRQVMDTMDKQIRNCRVANTAAQATLERTSFSKPFMGKFTQYCIKNHISLNPENRDAVKLNLINFMKASQCTAILEKICRQNGLPADKTGGFAKTLQASNIVEDAIEQIFAENPDGIPQHIDARLEQVFELALEPVLTFKALIPSDPRGSTDPQMGNKLLEDFCNAFYADNASNAVNTALDMYEQGIITAGETYKTFNYLLGYGIDNANPMGTAEEKNLAIAHFLLDKKMDSTIERHLEANGLPPSLAKALSHYPDFFATMQTALADANTDFVGGAFNEANFTAMVSENFSDFLVEKADVLSSFLSAATAVNIAEKDLSKCINAFVGSASFAEDLLPNEGGVGDKIAFIASMREANQALLSCTHGFQGDFGKDDSLKVMHMALSMHFAKLERPVTAENVRYMQKEFTKFASELASATSFLPPRTLSAKKDAVLRESLQLHELLNQTLVATSLSYLQTQGVAKTDIATHAVIDGKTIHDISSAFVEPIANPKTHPKSLAFIHYAESVGIPVQEDDLTTALADEYFRTSSDSAHAEPPVEFIRIIEELKQAFHLDKASLGGLEVDARLINSQNFYETAQKTLRTYKAAYPDEVLTEEKIRSLYNEAIHSRFVDFAAPLDHINVSGVFPVEQRQHYVNMVLATGITSLGILDSIAREFLPSYTHAFYIDMALDTGVNSLESLESKARELATSSHTPGLYMAARALTRTQDFPEVLPEVCTALTNSFTRISQGNPYDIAQMENTIELQRGLAMLLLQGAGLSDVQKDALADAVHGQSMEHFAKAIMTCRTSSELKSEGNTLVKLTRLSSLASVLQDEVDTYSGRVDAYDVMPFDESIASKTTELEKPHIDVLRSFVGPKLANVFTCADKSLAGLQPRVSDEDWATLNTAFTTLTKEAAIDDFDKDIVANIIVAKKDELLQASRSARAPLTAAQVAHTICAHSLPGIEAPTSLRTLKHMPQKLLADHTIREFSRQVQDVFVNAGITDENQAATQANMLLTMLVMSPSKVSNFIQTGTLRLEDIPDGLPLSSLEKYGASAGYGMYTDFQRMGPSSELRMESKGGQGLLVTPRPYPDGVENDPFVQGMIDFAASITQNETQQARVVQAFSQASKVNLRICSEVLGLRPLISEHSSFNITATQQDDNSVVVQIRSKAESPYNVVLDYNIPPDGSARCTDFLLQIGNQ